jgi:hypothetical protein
MHLWHAPTPRADVFALGQLLRRQTLMSGPKAGSGLDSAVQEVVRRATAWRPQERYADGAALAQAITRLLDGPPSAQAPAAAAHAHVARQRRVAAAPAARRPLSATTGRSGAQHSLCGALLPLALSLAIGLLPVASVAVHDVITHMPVVGFPLQRDDDGWRTGRRSWGQGYWWHQWRAGRPERSWTWGPASPPYAP